MEAEQLALHPPDQTFCRMSDVPHEPDEDRSEHSDKNTREPSPEVPTCSQFMDKFIIRVTLCLELTLMHIDHRLNVSLRVETAVMLRVRLLLGLRIRTITEHEIIESGVQGDGDLPECIDTGARDATIDDVVDRVKRY